MGSEHGDLSPAQRLALLPHEKQRELLEALTPEDRARLPYDWRFWRRGKQVDPWERNFDGLIWLLLAGRGFGKGRTAAELIRTKWSHEVPIIHLLGRTTGDVRDVMVQQIINTYPPHEPQPDYQPSLKRLVLPTGCVCRTYSAEEPALLRGPDASRAWADEIAQFRSRESLDMLQLGIRTKAAPPRIVYTTTPAAVPWVVDYVNAANDPDAKLKVHLTVGSTYENLGNLAEGFRESILSTYAGTTLERQEIFGELLTESSDALMTRAAIEGCRVGVPGFPDCPELKRCVVALDPSVSATQGTSNSCGIAVVGEAVDGQIVVLGTHSRVAKPEVWAAMAIELWAHYRATAIVAEANQGGLLVQTVLNAAIPEGTDPRPRIELVHASRNKMARAEIIPVLAERHMFLVHGYHAQLESELCMWQPGSRTSPDTLDAVTWGATWLAQLGAGQRKWRYESWMIDSMRTPRY